MPQHYFVSDLHLNHRMIIKYSNRKQWAPPGLEHTEDRIEIQRLITNDVVQKMNYDLIENINRTVGEKDTLWILGDFCFAPKNEYVQVVENFISQIKCSQLNILFGNHDQPSRIKHLFKIADKHLSIAINPENGDFECNEESNNKKIKKTWINLFLCHYLTASWPGKNKSSIHAYGHSHGEMESWANEHLSGYSSLDVGVDNTVKLVGEYRPLSLQEVVQYSNLRIKPK